MGRLIDVSDLEKFIRENVTVVGDDHLLLVAATDGKWHEALPLIKTAYDVNKVVEQLEEFRPEMEQFGCGGILTDIIDVVKAGGADAEH